MAIALSPNFNVLWGILTYTIKIENTGNLTLSNLTLNDQLTDGGGGNLTLTSGPTFSSATAGSTSTTVAVGGVVSYTATFNITQNAANTGSVNNTVTVIDHSSVGA